MKSEILSHIEESQVAIRRKRPVVHNITNYVVMNWTANCLLSVNASPVMAHAKEEMEDMVAISDSLVINIGTLSTPWIESMQIAMKAAALKKIPIVLDPVGSGATPLRTRTALNFIKEFKPTIIRGNASEINSLVEATSTTKGVDSALKSQAALTSACEISKTYDCVVCVSGEVDYVVSGTQVAEIKNGHSWMAQVTGMGCAATALIGAFAAVNPDPYVATVSAMTFVGIAGEIAAKKALGPGSFATAFLDTLNLIDVPMLRETIQVSEYGLA